MAPRSASPSRTVAAAAAAIAAAAVAAAALAATPATAAAATPAADGGGLAPFASCSALLDYIRSEAVSRVGPYGFRSNPWWRRRGDFRSDDFRARRVGGPPSAVAEASAGDGGGGEAGVDFSDTNTQVDGVAEADVVKTDGASVYTLVGSTLRVVATAAGGGDGIETGVLALGGDTSPDEMLLGAGGRLLIVGRGWGVLAPTPTPSPSRRPDVPPPRRVVPSEEEVRLQPGGIPTSAAQPKRGQLTVVWTVDASDRRAPKLLSTTRLEGRYVSSRSVGGVARLVLAASPPSGTNLPFRYPGGRPRPGRHVVGLSKAQAEAVNKMLVLTTTLQDWFPRFRTEPAGDTRGGVTTGYVASCTRTYRPAAFAGYNVLSIVTLPLDADAPLSSLGSGTAIFAGGNTVYSSIGSVYVATTNYREVLRPIPNGPRFHTSIHQFSIDNGTKGATYRGSGVVGGSVLNQFSMHENNDTFYVATTLGAPWWRSRNTRVSEITALRRAAGAPASGPSPLTEVGKVGNLGRGERIYAVRYIGAAAYVVTFRQVDPLYIISLTDMVATGELKIPGFSSYLHPVGPGRLLGVGQDATETGRTTGVKVTLFDVSDVRAPRELATWAEPDFASSSSVQWDHRAFLYWAPRRLAVLPVNSYGRDAFRGAVVLRLGDAVITEAGRVTHPPLKKNRFASTIDRTFVIGREWLWTRSRDRFQVQSLPALRVSGSVVFGPALGEEKA